MLRVCITDYLDEEKQETGVMKRRGGDKWKGSQKPEVGWERKQGPQREDPGWRKDPGNRGRSWR